MMTHLDKLESKSIYIIREAFQQFKKVALLWSIGKDSTTLLWLCKKAFLGKLPIPVIHIDTSFKFKEIYQFRDKYTNEWELDLITGKNEKALREGVSPQKETLECCTQLKTNALKSIIEKHKFKALLLGIRRDEHGIRAKERYFSPRDDKFKWDYKNQPLELWDQYKSKSEEDQHLRIHPLLHWREIDIWQYIQREQIPVNELYFAENGKRYRSIGCLPCCSPVDSQADNLEKIIEELQTTTTAERAGRSQDKESVYRMQKLRSLGYM